MRKKIHIRQTDSYDCGAACLASVAAWWGIRLPLSHFRRECGCSKDGISIRGITDGAAAVGLNARALKAENLASLDLKAKAERLQALSSSPSPVIAHTVSEKGMLHYVVIFGVGKKKLQVMDPAKDRMTWVNIVDFAQRWSGYIILADAGDGMCETDGCQSRKSRLLRLLSFHRREVVLALAGSIFLAGTGICNSLLLQVIIDKVLPSGNYSALAVVSAVLLCLIPISLIIGYMRDMYLLRGGIAIDSGLIRGFMRRILKMDERFFRDYPKGELESRLSDTVKIRVFICEGAVSLGVCVVTLVAVTALMFSFYGRLASLLATCIPVYVILLGAADRLNRKMSRKVMAAASAFETDVIDCLEGQAEIRHFGIEPSELNYNNSYSDLVFRNLKAGKLSAAVNGLGSGISQLIMALILIVGGTGVLGGRLSLGELVSFYTLSVFFISSMSSLVGFDSLMNEALVASDRIYDITSSYSSLHGDRGIPSVLVGSGADSVLEFKDVEFRHPGGRRLLEGFSARIPHSSITFIEGPNGSGKSTLASLMTRDCRPLRGKITYGGIDIFCIDSKCWRDTVSIVPQNSHLFNATIFDNIAMTPGRREDKIDGKDLERAAEAAVMAGMGPMLERLDKGMLSNVGPSGVTLSAGERQMILIARTLYSDTPIMIFDEAFSNMDREGRASFERLMLELRERGKAVVVISHEGDMARLSDNTIRLTG